MMSWLCSPQSSTEMSAFQKQLMAKRPKNMVEPEAEEAVGHDGGRDGHR